MNTQTISKQNPNIIQLETQYFTEEALRRLPIILKRCIEDFEDFKRDETQDDLFDVYEYIAEQLSLSTHTIRTWLNRFNPSYPKLDQLENLCRVIGDKKPLQYIAKEWMK